MGMKTLNADTGDIDLRTLSDIELDDVSGGICWWKITLIVIALAIGMA